MSIIICLEYLIYYNQSLFSICLIRARIINVVIKVKTVFRFYIVSWSINAEGNYTAKSDPIISLFLLIFRSVSLRRTMLSHSICFFRYLLYLHVRVLFAEPNSILFEVLFVYLPYISIVPLQSILIAILMSHSLIFSPRTRISDRLFYLFLSIFPPYLRHFLSFLFSRLFSTYS